MAAGSFHCACRPFHRRRRPFRREEAFQDYDEDGDGCDDAWDNNLEVACQNDCCYCSYSYYCLHYCCCCCPCVRRYSCGHALDFCHLFLMMNCYWHVAAAVAFFHCLSSRHHSHPDDSRSYYRHWPSPAAPPYQMSAVPQPYILHTITPRCQAVFEFALRRPCEVSPWPILWCGCE